MNLTVFGYSASAFLGACILVAGVIGMLYSNRSSLTGWGPFRATGAANPDRRQEFVNRLHWITEFCRNDVADPQMVKACTTLYERFAEIPEAK